MTTDVVSAANQGGSVALPDDFDFAAGLEDIRASDLSLPRLSLDHKTAKFVDSLDGREYDKLRVIVLGVVRQRILFPAEVKGDESKRPLCRSLNFWGGMPDHERFPWAKSGFNPNETHNVFDDKGNPAQGDLPCQVCPLKDWNSHPARETTWCTEQWVLPVLMPVGTGWAPAIVTFQRSALKATKAYITSFVRKQMPPFTSITEITLELQRNGSVDYSTPRFAEVEDVPQDRWPELAQELRRLRAFLQTPRRRDDEAEELSAEQSQPAPASAPTGAPQASAPAATPASVDEVPF